MAAPRVESTTVAARDENRGKMVRREFEASLDVFKPRLAEIVGPQQAQRIAALAFDAGLGNPDIFQCTPQSVLRSLIKVARSGLELGEEIHLVPVKDRRAGVTNAEAWYDWKGLAKLLLQGGVVRKVNAEVVREGDYFEYELGASPFLRHRPAGERTGAIIGAYAVAQLRGGVSDFEYMTVAEIEKHRPQTATFPSSPWVKHFAEMCRKTPLKSLAKRLPKSPKMQQLADEAPDDEATTPAAMFSGREVPSIGYGESGHERQMTRAEIAAAASAPDPYAEVSDVPVSGAEPDVGPQQADAAGDSAAYQPDYKGGPVPKPGKLSDAMPKLPLDDDETIQPRPTRGESRGTRIRD